VNRLHTLITRWGLKDRLDTAQISYAWRSPIWQGSRAQWAQQGRIRGRVTGDLVRRLEEDIDAFEAELVPLANFILPGGTRLASALHQSRTTARRAEIQVTRLQQSQAVNRNCAKYLNRLSDLLFVIARVANKRGGMPDTVWKSHG